MTFPYHYNIYLGSSEFPEHSRFSRLFLGAGVQPVQAYKEEESFKLLGFNKGFCSDREYGSF